MHAALVTITIDPSQAPAAARGSDGRHPAAPHLSAGVSRPDTGSNLLTGMVFSILLFDTEEHTREAAEGGWQVVRPGSLHRRP